MPQAPDSSKRSVVALQRSMIPSTQPRCAKQTILQFPPKDLSNHHRILIRSTQHHA